MSRTNHDIMELVSKPALKDIASIITSELVNTNVFGYYGKSHLFITNYLTRSFNLSTFEKGQLEKELKMILFEELENKEPELSFSLSNEIFKSFVQPYVDEKLFCMIALLKDVRTKFQVKTMV
jgi:hypothetical protein